MQPNAGRAKFERSKKMGVIWGEIGGDLGEIWGDETQAETNFSDHYVFGAVIGF